VSLKRKRLRLILVADEDDMLKEQFLG
jgi:hypothetical protein